MKICLYIEAEYLLNGSGIGSAVEHQRKALQLNDVSHTSDSGKDFDIIHINVIGPKSLYVAKKMRRQGKKVVLHAHSIAEDFRNSYFLSNLCAPALKRYLTYYYNQADHVLCPSDYARRMLEEYGVKCPITVVSNGIDTDYFAHSEELRKSFRREYSLEGNVPFCVAHLFRRKGIESFVRVARDMDNDFVWVGRNYRLFGDPRVRMIVKSAPDNITFTGPFPRSDIISAYSGGDIFFFPSLCETQGIVILEACACGKPVVLRDIPAYEGWMTHGVNCIKAKSDEEFKTAIKDLMDDKALYNKLSKEAVDTSKKHSLRNVGCDLKRTYEEVLRC